MCGVKEVGRYNVDYAGDLYDGNTPYNMLIFDKFDGNKPIEGSRKTLYFLALPGCITPSLKSEEEVEQFYLTYSNCSKIKVWEKKELVIEIIR